MRKLVGNAAIDAAKALGLTSVHNDGLRISLSEAKDVVQMRPEDIYIWLSPEQQRKLSALSALSAA